MSQTMSTKMERCLQYLHEFLFFSSLASLKPLPAGICIFHSAVRVKCEFVGQLHPNTAEECHPLTGTAEQISFDVC